MDDQRFGSMVRAVRVKRRLRQSDLARRAGVSREMVSRIERGRVETMPLRSIRRVTAALDMRADLVGRWRAGDLDRLLNAKHSAMHEQVARMFRDELPDWTIEPEVSFSIYGERGVIDVVGWHEGRRTLLVVELKTDIVDVNDLIGTVDRKRRLASVAVRDRGWSPETVSAWVIVAAGRTNRGRISAHGAVLRAAFPMDGRAVRGWLRDPQRSIAALSTWRVSHPLTTKAVLVSTRRVRP
jgi:transcriptional regulator with XRE-family HTH domain